MSDSRAVYQRVLEHFTALVDSISPEQWSAPTPCEGWTVRDLIEHIVVRDARIAASVGGPPAGDPPAPDAALPALWKQRVRWWAAGLDDPERRDVVWPTALGELTFTQATMAMMTGELAIHTWDLARALGVDDTVDPEAVHSAYLAMKHHGDALRRPGAMGPEVEAPAGSSEQVQLIAFTGRQP
jgi:uncharacterized protein (TIGR03086 family)